MTSPWYRSAEKLLSLILWLIAAHSFAVGLGLIIQPAALMELVGFGRGAERFFSVQGGTFHLVMAIAYGMAARNVVRNRPLVLFSLIVKAVATVFLLTYYFAVDDKWIVLLSALGDGVMCLAIYFGYRLCRFAAGQGT